MRVNFLRSHRKCFAEQGAEYEQEMQILRFIHEIKPDGFVNVITAIENFTVPNAVIVYPLGLMNLTKAFTDLPSMIEPMRQRQKMISSYGLDAARGVAFLHANNIAHLDIKPQNGEQHEFVR